MDGRTVAVIRPGASNRKSRSTVALIDTGTRDAIPRRGKIRRCRVRHVSVLPRPQRGIVQVDCLLGGAEHSLPLGTMDEARAICGACTATTIWRTDED